MIVFYKCCNKFSINLGLQTEFDRNWADGLIDSTNWSNNASTKALLAYRLLVQTGNPSSPIDTSLVGCLPPQTTCQRVSFL